MTDKKVIETIIAKNNCCNITKKGYDCANCPLNKGAYQCGYIHTGIIVQAKRWLDEHSNKEKPMTQNSMILNHLNQRPITPAEAYEKLGVMRLSARIYDLRNQGYSISMELKTAKNRFGAVVTFAEYRLESE